MTTPTSEPTLSDRIREIIPLCSVDVGHRCRRVNSHLSTTGWLCAHCERVMRGPNVARDMALNILPEAIDTIEHLRTALANAEREREQLSADYTIALRMYQEVINERDALQRTVAGLEAKAKAAWMEHAFCGDQAPSGQWFIDVVREKPTRFPEHDADELQKELDDHMRECEASFNEWSRKYDAALTTPTREGSV